MDESLALRITAIFVIFLASILGICFPFIANSENVDSAMFRMLKAGSAGVMLGLAVVS
jgi:Mg/Co/Ni transporter MgtE